MLDVVLENVRRDAARREAPVLPDESSFGARRAFYEAAALFEDVAPWHLASDQDVMGVDIPALGWTKGCAAVLGGAGRGYGLGLFRSADDYLTLAGLAVAGEQALDDVDGVDVDVLGVCFDSPRKVPGGREVAKAALALGWTPGPRRHLPWLTHVGADGVPNRLTTGDCRLPAAVSSLRAPPLSPWLG